MRTTERNKPDSMLIRVAAILDLYNNEQTSFTISEISRGTGLAKSTVSRICQEMVEHGFLERSDNQLFLGLRLFELGKLATRPQDLRKLTLARMAELRQLTGHTIHLAVLEGTEVVYIEILSSRNSPRMPSRVGGRMPAFATGVGKALLAYSQPEVVERVIAEGLWQVGPKTLTDPDQLRASLEEYRQRGVGQEVEESGKGICCTAAPILSQSGEPIAALSVSGWKESLDIELCRPAVKAAALAINRELSRRPGIIRNLAVGGY